LAALSGALTGPVPVATTVAAVAPDPATTAAIPGQDSTTSARILPPPVVRTLPLDAPQDEIVVTGRNTRGDPLEAANEAAFAVTQAADDAIVAPAARAYKKVPSQFRIGLRNFLANFREPVVAANFLLQGKPGKAAETVGRFAINTTVGIAGILDMARRRPFRLPRRRNSFANTLGFYGIGPGPFFFLPLIGATTLRDLLGNVTDQVIVPLGPIRPLRGGAATVPIGVLSALDYRIEFDEDLSRAKAGADPYAAVRAFYLRRRQAEIDHLRGRPDPVGGPPAPRAPAGGTAPR